MQESSDEDIEIISIEKTGVRKPVTNQTDFILQELGITSLQSDVTFENINRALSKYEVEATDDQIRDMVTLANSRGMKYVMDSSN